MVVLSVGLSLSLTLVCCKGIGRYSWIIGQDRIRSSGLKLSLSRTKHVPQSFLSRPSPIPYPSLSHPSAVPPPSLSRPSVVPYPSLRRPLPVPQPFVSRPSALPQSSLTHPSAIPPHPSPSLSWERQPVGCRAGDVCCRAGLKCDRSVADGPVVGTAPVPARLRCRTHRSSLTPLHLPGRYTVQIWKWIIDTTLRLPARSSVAEQVGKQVRRPPVQVNAPFLRCTRVVTLNAHRIHSYLCRN